MSQPAASMMFRTFRAIDLLLAALVVVAFS
jgi:hypothetical protein